MPSTNCLSRSPSPSLLGSTDQNSTIVTTAINIVTLLISEAMLEN